MNFLSGYKTYAAAVGMLGLALYQAFNVGDYALALQSLMAALGLFGLRQAVSK